MPFYDPTPIPQFTPEILEFIETLRAAGVPEDEILNNALQAMRSAQLPSHEQKEVDPTAGMNRRVRTDEDDYYLSRSMPIQELMWRRDVESHRNALARMRDIGGIASVGRMGGRSGAVRRRAGAERGFSNPLAAGLDPSDATDMDIPGLPPDLDIDDDMDIHQFDRFIDNTLVDSSGHSNITHPIFPEFSLPSDNSFRHRDYPSIHRPGRAAGSYNSYENEGTLSSHFFAMDTIL